MTGLMPIYDRLMGRVQSENYHHYELFEESSKVTTLLSKISESDPESGILLSNLIYAIIYHHESVSHTGLSFRSIAYDGMKLPGGRGVTFLSRMLPPVLQQIIFLLVNEIIQGTCPEHNS